jgi:hypothetical protein
MTFSLSPPANVTNLFGNWLSGIAKNVWHVRNDFIFNKPKSQSFL